MSKKDIEHINKLHSEDKHKDIIEYISSLPDKEKSSYDIVCLLARAYNNVETGSEKEEKENLEKAIELFKSVEKKGIKDPLWHYRIGYSYFYNDMEEIARDHFMTAINLIPKTKKDVEKWKEFNLLKLVRDCNDIIESKEIDKNFGSGQDASEDEVIQYILHSVLHRSLPIEDIIMDNSIYIPEWDLAITPEITLLAPDRIDIEWQLNSSKLDYGIIEETYGAGENIRGAINMAINSFVATLLDVTIKSIIDFKYTSFNTTFKDEVHSWNTYIGLPLMSLDNDTEPDIQEESLYDILEDDIKNRLGNQSMVCIKIYGAKIGDKIIGECRIDEAISAEMSQKVKEFVEKNLNMDDDFTTIKQYFIIKQKEETIKPYIYSDKEGYEELKQQILKICYVMKDSEINDEESFHSTIDDMVEATDDITLSMEAIMLIPEIFASNVYEHISFPEKVTLGYIDEDTNIYYLQQLSDYSRIFKAVWEIFDNILDESIRDEVYNKFINMSLTLSSLSEEEIEGSEKIEAPNLEIIVDERFEIR